MTGRPALRMVGGGAEDSVVRRRRFEEAHPEAVILPPCAGRWRAVDRGGRPRHRTKRYKTELTSIAVRIGSNRANR